MLKARRQINIVLRKGYAAIVRFSEVIYNKNMDKHDADIVYFISFCIENYKKRCGKTGAEVMSLFDKSGVTDYLAKNYDSLQSQSAQWLMEELDDYIGKMQYAGISRKS